MPMPSPAPEERITSYVIVTCIIAASGGLMFGYDLGISGGVISMDDFLLKFFPHIYHRRQKSYDATHDATESGFCTYDTQMLQLFTSSLYMAAIVATFFASIVTRKYGRRMTMLIAGLFFDAGVSLNAGAENLRMLIIGRILLGFGVGFANQAVPVFLSEIAPTHQRGGLNILFQLDVTIGIFFANIVNYGTERIGQWGWRLSFALAGIPALILTFGSLVLVDTPNSLIERGHNEEAKVVLRKIRGTHDINAEYQDLVEASRIANTVRRPFRHLFQRRNIPQLVITAAVQIFQQLTGIDAILLYAPVVFGTLGSGRDAALYCAVIIGTVNVVSTLASIYLVDRVGRRALLLEACVQMFIALVLLAILVRVVFHGSHTSPGSIFVVIVLCVFVSAYAWSWGPLGWLISSEIFPLETRSAGQSVTVCINMLFTSIIAHTSLSMLCHFHFYGMSLFFACWVVVVGIFTFCFLPETTKIPIEVMALVWRHHWFWKGFVPPQDDQTSEFITPPLENTKL